MIHVGLSVNSTFVPPLVVSSPIKLSKFKNSYSTEAFEHFVDKMTLTDDVERRSKAIQSINSQLRGQFQSLNPYDSIFLRSFLPYRTARRWSKQQPLLFIIIVQQRERESGHSSIPFQHFVQVRTQLRNTFLNLPWRETFSMTAWRCYNFTTERTIANVQKS